MREKKNYIPVHNRDANNSRALIRMNPYRLQKSYIAAANFSVNPYKN
jgi:hypothetical protein